ncbi:hypothetical protein IMSAGC013_04209 [Lachnospiraceae bacterium]|nr:hypothetical protein IMSAGC013_04209 [Lachnospiraceae bacterium]
MWMEYEEFVEAVQKRMEKEIGERGSVFISSMEKNNRTHWEGLEIKEKESRVGTVFQLKVLYAVYQRGGMEHTVSYILEMLKNKPDHASWDIPGEWEAARECILPVLVNEEWNRESLEECSRLKILDLAAVCYLKLKDTDCRAITIVKGRYLEIWGITEEELWEAAMKNLQKEEYWIKPMSEILESMLGSDMGNFHDFSPMYVMTNKRMSYGAAGILRKGLLEEFSKEIQGNFYILPSSVHETLLLADEPHMKAEELREIVQSVNQKEVGREEWLSENVYYYDRETGELEIVL